MPVNKRSEVDVGVAIMGDFKRRGFQCYSEVVFNGVRLDLVCVEGEKITTVETKQHRSRTLLKQVLSRQEFSHNTVAATLAAYSTAEWFTQVLIDNDIGYMTVDRHTLHCDYPIQPNGNSPDRHLVDDLLNTLRKEHQEFAPPGSQGGSFTPENKMLREIQNVVAKFPEGISIDDLVESIRVGSTSKYGIFGSRKMATEGIPKFKKAGSLKGVQMINQRISKLAMKQTPKILTFYPNPKEVAA